jgi:hypothetical protein
MLWAASLVPAGCSLRRPPPPPSPACCVSTSPSKLATATHVQKEMPGLPCTALGRCRGKLALSNPCHSRLAFGLLAQGSGAVWPHVLPWLLFRPVLTPFLHRHVACSSPMAFPSCVSWLDGAPNRACTCVPSASAYRLFGSRPVFDAYQWAVFNTFVASHYLRIAMNC